MTYTVTATVSAAATGTLANTATVTAPAGVTDPTPGNNSATDTDTLTPQADLVDHQDRRRHDGGARGRRDLHDRRIERRPGVATGATVADTLPAALTRRDLDLRRRGRRHVPGVRRRQHQRDGQSAGRRDRDVHA